MQEINSKQKNFILLRADGLSFDKIATKLKVSKPTLIQWSKLFEDEIKDVQFQSYIQIKETYNHTKKAKYETLIKQLQKVDDYILDVDLSQTSVKDLFMIKNSLSVQLEQLERKTVTDPKVTRTNELGYKDQLTLSLYEID